MTNCTAPLGAALFIDYLNSYSGLRAALLTISPRCEQARFRWTGYLSLKHHLSQTHHLAYRPNIPPSRPIIPSWPSHRQSRSRSSFRSRASLLPASARSQRPTSCWARTWRSHAAKMQTSCCRFAGLLPDAVSMARRTLQRPDVVALAVPIRFALRSLLQAHHTTTITVGSSSASHPCCSVRPVATNSVGFSPVALASAEPAHRCRPLLHRLRDTTPCEQCEGSGPRGGGGGSEPPQVARCCWCRLSHSRDPDGRH